MSTPSPNGSGSNASKKQPSAAAPSPAQRETSPAQRETSPAQRETSPAQRETSPAQRETSPAQQETSPAQRETSPEELRATLLRLQSQGPAALEALPTERLLTIWQQSLEELLDVDSPPRRELQPALVEASRLSPAGLQAGLEALLGGLLGEALRALAKIADHRRRQTPPAAPADPAAPTHPAASPGPAAIVLAGNLPALAAQALLPALLARCPVLLKSPSSNPHFASALVRLLVRAHPPLAQALAATTWPGGDLQREAPLLELATPLVVYGDDATLASLRSRRSSISHPSDSNAIPDLAAYGPGWSLGILAEDALTQPDLARLLARDVALFDQRGCLSLRELWIQADPSQARGFALDLATALAREAEMLPPGPTDPATLAALRLEREVAMLRGEQIHAATPDRLEAGTVFLTTAPEPRLPPALRALRVHAVDDLESLIPRLSPFRGQIQGAALAGEGAWHLEAALEDLGAHHRVAPGRLQHADALWRNGGYDPLSLFGLPASAANS
ncbi:MAG: acyl-CoA reductase [Acidobacteriota bacterium]